MTKIRGVTGGGIDGNKVVHTSNPKVEPTSKIVGPGYVARLGQSQYPGAKINPMYEGRGYASSTTVRPATGQGPGSNHEVLKCGSQGQHGAAASGTARPGAGKDILNDFGPNRRR